MSNVAPAHQVEAGQGRSAAGIGKPYTCTRCRRSFRRAEHLSRHIRTHTKEKPFSCPCGLSFTRQDLLRRHERINHADDAQNLSTEDSVISQGAQVEDSMQPLPCLQQSSSLETLNHAREDPAPSGSGSSEGHVQAMLDTDTMLDFENMETLLHYDTENALSYVNNNDSLPNGARSVGDDRPPEDSHYLVEQRLHDAPNDAYESVPYGSWIPFIPPTPPNHESTVDKEPPPLSKAASAPFKLTKDQRSHLEMALQGFQTVIPNFRLPSQHTLSRYLTSFFETFHSYMPFVHVPTLELEACAPEFILAMATVGAQSRLEHRNADTLFFTSKAIVMERMRQQEHVWATYDNAERAQSSEVVKRAQLQTVRCIFLLLGYASWERPEILREAFGIKSILVRYLRRIGLHEDEANDAATWQEWAERECDRRIKLVAFCFLNMHSVAFDTPPVLMSSEIRLRLPCSTNEWDAPNAAVWQTTRSESQQLHYRKALSLLLTTTPFSPTPCPLGKYILMHGVLQRIFLVRELCSSIDDSRIALPEYEMDKIESALRTWISLWRINLETSLSTPNGNGPISITSNALLGLAHVRVHLNLGPYRSLEARDPTRTADSLFRAPCPERSERIIPALVYSAHALSIPVRLGIDFVAGSQAFRWSVRHAITGLETAVLLSKWLYALEKTRADHVPSESETKVFEWIARIVEEAWDSMDRDNETEEPLQLEPTRLGIAVIEIWARILQGNIQWPIIKFLGLSLDRYAAELREGS